MDDDCRWFQQRSRRQTRIRGPVADEFAMAWRLLGDHDHTRRRVLVWKVPRDRVGYHLIPDGLMRVPFLAFGDETIEDDDTILLCILDELMAAAAKAEAVRGFHLTGDTPFPGWVH
jgi:hypothetical protein